VIALLFDIIDISDYTGAMASIIIRNLDEKTKAALRMRAARGGRSMEEEARHILRAALARRSAEPGKVGTAIAARFRALGGIELPAVVREPMPASAVRKRSLKP
jgi:plasmid stability protein